ncbi:MAG TPA: energy transducer TonB [Terriglobales bacterium]
MITSRFSILGLLIFSAGLCIAQEPQPVSQAKVATPTSASESEPPPADYVPLGEPFAWKIPKYPKRALQNRLQGTVVLDLTVDEDGNVSSISALSGDPELVKAARDAVQNWEYIPYDINEQPVAVKTRVAVHFTMPVDGKPDVSVVVQNAPKPAIPGQFFQTLKGTNITPPKPVYSPDPRYSRKAKQDKYQGNCVLSLIVGSDGKPYDIKVSRFLGEGLDAMAIEAVRKWRFDPARKDGDPVAVAINVEVKFVLD